jgi:hypothetical protein
MSTKELISPYDGFVNVVGFPQGGLVDKDQMVLQAIKSLGGTFQITAEIRGYVFFHDSTNLKRDTPIKKDEIIGYIFPPNAYFSYTLPLEKVEIKETVKLPTGLSYSVKITWLVDDLTEVTASTPVASLVYTDEENYPTPPPDITAGSAGLIHRLNVESGDPLEPYQEKELFDIINIVSKITARSNGTVYDIKVKHGETLTENDTLIEDIINLAINLEELNRLMKKRNEILMQKNEKC